MSKIIVHTENNPEDNAMLQALYSRSSTSVTEHLEKLKDTGSGEFMSKYYLGYGHKSIADCGFVTVYFEGISMLAAKALEDHPLFNGQECSTRYIDFSNQPFVNPMQDYNKSHKDYSNLLDLSSEILESLRRFYIESFPSVIEELKLRFHRKPEQSETTYDKAIQARAFDILRGWLPAGATTNVAVTMSLRKFEEHLSALIFHPLIEVSQLALQAYEDLRSKYPHSFYDKFQALKVTNEVSTWYSYLEEKFPYKCNYYLRFGGHSFHNPVYDGIQLIGEKLSETPRLSITEFRGGLTQPHDTENIPRHYPIPRHAFPIQSRISLEVLLDFGSYRDLQRHRAGYCSHFPLHTAFLTNVGEPVPDHSWYKDQLPSGLREVAETLDRDIGQALEHILDEATFMPALELSYYMPMKSVVPVVLDYDIGQARYVAELRSGKTVHPTLRPVAQSLGKFLKEQGYACDFDDSEDSWTIKRGIQDIVEVTT